jgi:hypothetical protein
MQVAVAVLVTKVLAMVQAVLAVEVLVEFQTRLELLVQQTLAVVVEQVHKVDTAVEQVALA